MVFLDSSVSLVIFYEEIIFYIDSIGQRCVQRNKNIITYVKVAIGNAWPENIIHGHDSSFSS